jgi:Domain of unknown function (DUF4178)
MADWNSILQAGPGGQQFVCSTCSHTMPVFRGHQAEIIACPKCGTIYSKTHFDKYLKLKNNYAEKKSELLPLHSTGTYNDRSVTVIGIANKTEKLNTYGIWKEYVLLDDLGNIHFLNCSYGNYTILSTNHFIQSEKILEQISSNFEFEGNDFSFFSSYNYGTQNCAGEFLYDVIDVDTIKCYDFISPPYAISIEKKGLREYDAYSGKHLSRKEVAAIFNKPLIEFQDHEGVGMAQPFYGKLDVKRFNRLSLYFVSVMIVFLIIGSLFSYHGYYVAQIDGEINPATLETEFISKTFQLAESSTPYYMEFLANSSLNNEWLEFQMSLVNEKTGVEREFELGLEYYSGVDNGYAWSEGSESASVHLSSVEPGSYHLKVKALSPAFSEQTPFQLTVRTASPVAWNVWIILLPYLILWAIINLMKRQFERMRRGEIDSFFGSSQSS